MSLNPYSAEEAYARFDRRCRRAIGVLSVIAIGASVAIMALSFWSVHS